MSHDDRPVVVVVGPIPPPIHGAARVTGHIVSNLRDAGAAVVEVDTSGSDDGPLAYHLTRIRVHLRAARVVWQTRSTARSLYVAGAGGLGLWYQIFLIAAARLAGHHTVFHHHSYAYVSRRTVAMTALTRVGGRRLEHIALCEGMGRRLRATYPAIGELRVCSNAGLFAAPPAADPSDQPSDAGAGGLVLGHLGNLVIEKGLPAVIDTLRRLRADGVPARLLLGGPVPTEDAATVLAAAQLEFGDALVHLGAIPPDAVDDFYRRIDVFVFPSRYSHEAEPMVVLEASRCGIPTVAFRVGCLETLVPDADWLVAPGADFAPIAVGIVRSVLDAGERRRRRGLVLAHFGDQQRSAIDAQRRLVAALMQPRHEASRIAR